jgi:RNA polymerase-binding transcription factor DksA
MNNNKQRQIQLELERTITVQQVQQLTLAGVECPDLVNQQVLLQMQNKLNLIKKAQHRVNKGQYGICQSCQQMIDPERLEIFPYAEHCAACKRAVERQTFRK